MLGIKKKKKKGATKWSMVTVKIETGFEHHS